jgi:hypothetical protein
MPPQIPTMVPRRSTGKAAVRMVRLSGVTMAAPIPWTTRAMISTSAFGASAHDADPAVNTSRPAVKTRRRPSRSPRAAAVTMPAANARR